VVALGGDLSEPDFQSRGILLGVGLVADRGPQRREVSTRFWLGSEISLGER
jgi:hypothetical protein